uniref:Uncharacterized protein n=1 Tax=Corvus moneduloides TaxID=1196302 RepID=A0A8C3GWS6_CORMO
MFFERHLENILKFFIPSTTDPKKVLELVPLCKGYVRKLEIDQFLPPVQVDEKEESNDLTDTEEDANFNEAYTHHYDLKDLITALPHLEELHLTYGVKSCGMNFEWSLFNFTEQDCFSLAAAVKMCHNLKDGGKQLLEGLANNKTLTKLDLRHTEVEQETGFLIHQIVWANREACSSVQTCPKQSLTAGPHSSQV